MKPWKFIILKFQSKLDGYRADYNRGKELNDDQKSAIAKYEEVIQTLEFARELSGQFKTLVLDEDKGRKKLLKKEQLEKAKSEAQKLAQVIEIQVCLEIIISKCVKIHWIKDPILKYRPLSNICIMLCISATLGPLPRWPRNE